MSPCELRSFAKKSTPIPTRCKLIVSMHNFPPFVSVALLPTTHT